MRDFKIYYYAFMDLYTFDMFQSISHYSFFSPNCSIFSQRVPLLSLFLGSFDITLVVFDSYLTFWHNKMPQAHLTQSLPQF